MKAIVLCRLEEIEDPGARGFELEGPQGEIFAVRLDSDVFAYRNRCPHTGVNLNWQPNQFLNADGALIQCAIHGAQFRIEDGLCVWGPCTGESLEALPTNVVDGKVQILVNDTPQD